MVPSLEFLGLEHGQDQVPQEGDRNHPDHHFEHVLAPAKQRNEQARRDEKRDDQACKQEIHHGLVSGNSGISE
jgi:hypothetical protein